MFLRVLPLSCIDLKVIPDAVSLSKTALSHGGADGRQCSRRQRLDFEWKRDIRSNLNTDLGITYNWNRYLRVEEEEEEEEEEESIDVAGMAIILPLAVRRGRLQQRGLTCTLWQNLKGSLFLFQHLRLNDKCQAFW